VAVTCGGAVIEQQLMVPFEGAISIVKKGLSKEKRFNS
jgi:hypothetical protein